MSDYHSTLDGDGPCDDCGTPDNIVWFTDEVFWHNVVQIDRSRWDGREPILCLECFVRLAEERGMRPTGWRVAPEWPWREDEAVRLAVATAATKRWQEADS